MLESPQKHSLIDVILSYITLMIPKGRMSRTAAVHDYIGDFGEITELSETMNVFAVHGDENRRMSYLDVVEIGANLPDGTGLIVCAYCPYGHTKVYDLLITVLSSITNTTVLENWLNNEWIPMVTKQQSYNAALERLPIWNSSRRTFVLLELCCIDICNIIFQEII